MTATSEQHTPVRAKFREQGFTLIELLVVILIIGVLSQIALSTFQVYKTRAYDTHALEAIHDLINAQQAYYIDHNTYGSSLPLPGFSAAHNDVQIDLSGDTNGFEVETYHPRGSRTFQYDSTTNGSIVETEGLPTSGSSI